MPLLEPLESGCSVTAPLKHGRRSTFHQWPQHLFPSLRNNLDTDLETPYVFDHFTGSFYWTREDALKDIKWNVWTDPPCLNCVVKSLHYAKSCDRMRRQEKSRGLTRCCTNCKRAENEDGCVEMIEVRIDMYDGLCVAAEYAQVRNHPEQRNGYMSVRKYDRSLGRRGKTFIDDIIWTDTEKELRKKGLVVWRPINLQFGDAGAKGEVFEQFEAGAGRSITLTTILEDGSRFLRKIEDISFEFDVRDGLKKMVEEWDAEPEVDDLMIKLDKVLGSPDKMTSPQLPASEAEPADSDSTPRELGFEDVCEHWAFMLGQAREDLYTLEVKSLGRAAANRTANGWDKAAIEVIPQVRIFLEKKMKLIVEDEMGVNEANEEAARKVTETARFWFHKLIPEMITT